MQSLNNLSPRGRQLLIGGLTLFIALPLMYFVYNATGTSDPTRKGTYYDKGSGETVTNNDQTPETFGTNGDNQTYLGTSELLPIGVSKYQIDALKSALTTYGKTRSPQASEYSVTTASIKVGERDPNDSDLVDTVVFDVLVNRKDTYKATLRYFNISSAQLTLRTKGGQIIFTSKEIDGSAPALNE